jgi:hypothetical protein
MSWLIPSLRRLSSPVRESEKRILAIWDFSTQPYGIGDLLTLQEATSILRLIYQIDKIDYCFLCEPNEPARPSFKQLGVNSSNYIDFITSLMHVVLVNPNLGSFFLFDSRSDLERYIADNIQRYQIWPSVVNYGNYKMKIDSNYGYIWKLIAEFYKEHQSLPYLSCRSVLVDWANSFISQHVLPSVPVVVHLRRNTGSNTQRNSRVECWLEMFKHCEERFPVKFIVICSFQEVDERLRDCSNVIIAKDFHTTVEQDLALIQTSAFYMGGPSGPTTMAVFSEKPYVYINFLNYPEIAPIVKTGPEGLSLIFANQHQRLVCEPETTQLLIQEFTRFFSSIDISAWQAKANNQHTDPFDIVPLKLR